MSRTDHSRHDRHKNKNPKATKQSRTILRQQIAREDWDSIPTRVPTSEIRTYERTGF